MSLVIGVVFSVISFVPQQGDALAAGEPALRMFACADGEDLVIRAAVRQERPSMPQLLTIARHGEVRVARTLGTIAVGGAPAPIVEWVIEGAGGPETRGEIQVTCELASPVPLSMPGEDDAAWDAVADGLRAMGRPAVELLVEEIGRGDSAKSAGLLWMLGRLGIEPGLAVPPLAGALAGGGEDLQRTAAEALARFGSAGVRALADALDGADETRCALVAKALAAAGRDARGAVPELAHALRHHDARIRRAVADGIARIGPDVGATAPALASALLDGDRSVRMAALWALASIGPDATVAAAELRLMQRSADAGVRGRSAVALARAGRIEDVLADALVQALDDPEADIRAMAAEASRRLGFHHPDLIPRLTAALLDPDPVVQWEAGAALMRI